MNEVGDSGGRYVCDDCYARVNVLYPPRISIEPKRTCRCINCYRARRDYLISVAEESRNG